MNMRIAKFALLTIAATTLLCASVFADGTQPAPPPIVVVGVITVLDASQKQITLNGQPPTAGPSRVPAMRSIVFRCNDQTVIKKDDKVVGFDALALKDDCTAQLTKTSTGGLVALNVLARTPRPPITTAQGAIGAVDTAASTFDLVLRSSDPATAVVLKFSVDLTTKIMKDGKLAGLADLAKGDLATVAFNPPPPDMGPVVRPIHALVVEARTPPPPPVPPAHFRGRLVSVSDSKVIAVAGPDGTVPKQFQVTPDTKIVKFHPAGLDALVKGDMLDVAFNGASDAAIPPAFAIMVMPELARGTIAVVDVLNGVVAIKMGMMPARAFKVLPDTVILRNGLPLGLGDLKVGDMAEVRFFHFKDIDVAAAISARGVAPPLPPR